MNWIQGAPSLDQVAAHAKAHRLYTGPKKAGNTEVYVIESKTGVGTQVTVKVSDRNDQGQWLVDMPYSGVQLAHIRVIKGVVYERNSSCFAWHALTGDWEKAKYFPVTRKGLPTDYAEI